MTSASSLAFPGSRTLATWWRQLAPFQPQTLHVGYLFLHRLEALGCWLQPQPLDPLLLLVLEALLLNQGTPPPSTPFYERLHERLHLDVPILRRLVRALADAQMVEVHAVDSAPEPTWKLTDQGREALQTRSVWTRQWQRGVFPFVEQLDPTGQRLAPPHFTPIQDAPSSSWHVEDPLAFDVAWLHQCLAQPVGWKHTFHFPLDLATLAAPADANAWQNVVLDRAERLLVVLCQGPGPAHDLLGFGVRPEGWLLHTAEPILRLPAAARIIARELNQPAGLELWTGAWQAWCQLRTVPAAFVAECVLAREGERLRIAAPEGLVQYLLAGKSDVFKGETWVLAGDGYLREAARLEVLRQ